jgi:hypothetical protein
MNRAPRSPRVGSLPLPRGGRHDQLSDEAAARPAECADVRTDGERGAKRRMRDGRSGRLIEQPNRAARCCRPVPSRNVRPSQGSHDHRRRFLAPRAFWKAIARSAAPRVDLFSVLERDRAFDDPNGRSLSVLESDRAFGGTKGRSLSVLERDRAFDDPSGRSLSVWAEISCGTSATIIPERARFGEKFCRIARGSGSRALVPPRPRARARQAERSREGF